MVNLVHNGSIAKTLPLIMKETTYQEGGIVQRQFFEETDIFKYGMLEDVERTLKNCTIGFSFLKDYNDPFENSFRYIHRFKNEDDRNKFYTEVQYENHPVNRMEKLISDELKTYVVTCFSKTPFEPLMWAHYSDKHQGVCYCFDKNLIFDKYEYSFRDIRYSNLFPDINIFQDKLSMAQITPQIEDVILTKSESWGYEKEFRFYKKSKNKIHSFNPQSLSGIILGTRISETEKTNIETLLSEYNKLNNTQAKLMHSTPSNSNYEVTIGYDIPRIQSVTCPLYDSTQPIIK